MIETDDQPIDETPGPAATSAQAGETDGTDQDRAAVATEPVTPEADATEATTTTEAGPTSSTGPVPVVSAATTMNACAPQLMNPELLNVKLYYPASNRDRVDTFVTPLAVRFLGAQGEVLQTLDTSGAMETGLVPGMHGWLGVANATGTYASFEDAPPPRYWGVLVNFQDVNGWQTIQTLDPLTNSWMTNTAC